MVYCCESLLFVIPIQFRNHKALLLRSRTIFDASKHHYFVKKNKNKISYFYPAVILLKLYVYREKKNICVKHKITRVDDCNVVNSCMSKLQWLHITETLNLVRESYQLTLIIKDFFLKKN